VTSEVVRSPETSPPVSRHSRSGQAAVTDQSSILRFIKDNRHLPRLGNGSADAGAGSLTSMFDFRAPRNRPLDLDTLTGEPAR
jgi:phospholipase C